jgi:hypothetical protein
MLVDFVVSRAVQDNLNLAGKPPCPPPSIFLIRKPIVSVCSCPVAIANSIAQYSGIAWSRSFDALETVKASPLALTIQNTKYRKPPVAQLLSLSFIYKKRKKAIC